MESLSIHPKGWMRCEELLRYVSGAIVMEDKAAAASRFKNVGGGLVGVLFICRISAHYI